MQGGLQHMLALAHVGMQQITCQALNSRPNRKRQQVSAPLAFADTLALLFGPLFFTCNVGPVATLKQSIGCM
jgi:hypothetical protein